MAKRLLVRTSPDVYGCRKIKGPVNSREVEIPYENYLARFWCALQCRVQIVQNIRSRIRRTVKSVNHHRLAAWPHQFNYYKFSFFSFKILSTSGMYFGFDGNKNTSNSNFNLTVTLKSQCGKSVIFVYSPYLCTRWFLLFSVFPFFWHRNYDNYFIL